MILTKGLSLVSKKVNHDVKVEVAQGTNFYFVVDVSGSMSSELPKIRTQLKNKLSTLLKEDDRISIVWFASNNQAGILQESVQVSNLEQLSKLHNAIDKFLQPMGCTAFVKPIQLVKDIIERVKSSNPNAMIFLTDGYNNDCSWKDVITAVKEVEPLLTSTTFVEYGYYADSKRLQELAELSGGEKITSASFDAFDNDFSKKLSTPISSSKKTKVDIDNISSYSLVFALSTDNEIICYNAESGSILVPSNVNEVIYFSNQDDNQELSETNLYVTAYVLANKLMVEDAEFILSKTGDIKLAKQYSTAFGKQKLFDFIQSLKDSIVKPELRYSEGKSENITIDDNAYCLLDVISDLQALDAKFYPYHGLFKYNRISRARENKSAELSEDVKKQLLESQTVVDAENILNLFKESNKPLKFEIYDESRGYPITDLVYNEKRANLSARCRVDGFVRLKENEFCIDKVDTFQYKTFNIICDGMVNSENLIVSFDKGLNSQNEKLLKYLTPINESRDGLVLWLLDLTQLPLINRSMYKSLSAVELAKLQYDLEVLGAKNKVFKTEKDRTNNGLLEIYGADALVYLESLGFSDGSGFQPKKVQAEASDSYVAVSLEVKIKGLSSLPSIAAVNQKLDKIDEAKKSGGKEVKLTLGESLMYDAMKEFDATKKINETVSVVNKEMADNYMQTAIDSLNYQKRILMAEKAKQIFTLVASRKWFKEFSSLDENKLTAKLGGQDLEVTFDYKEVDVNI